MQCALTCRIGIWEGPGALMQDAPETTAAGLVERQGRTGLKDENRRS